MSAISIVDPHLHYWSLASGNQPWLENSVPNLLGDYSPMAQDHLPEDLERARGEVDIQACVHVEADAVDPVAETRWLAEVIASGARLAPDALVVGVDLSRGDAEEQLDAQRELSDRVCGVRQILNVHDDPLFDYVGRDYVSEPGWRSNLRMLASRGLSFDLQIYPSQMAQAAALARECDDILFVLNHAGMYVDRQHLDGWRAWRDGLRELAACDNVMIKLSGFGMLDHRWTRDAVVPLVWEAIDAFGIERAMFASNFPVDGLYAGYEDIWRTYLEIVTGVSDSERDALFRDNARRCYRL